MKILHFYGALTLVFINSVSFALEKEYNIIDISLRRTGLALIDMPFDNIQTTLQTSKQNTTYLKTVSNIYKEKGIKSFWRGTIPRLGVVSIKSLSQTSFFHLVPSFTSSYLGHEFTKNASIAFGIGLTDTFLTNALEVQKVRLMTRKSGSPSVPIRAIEYFTKGGLSTFHISFGSWFIFLESEERLRHLIKERKVGRELRFHELFMIGLTTGVFDSCWTTPFQNIKNRQQSFYSASKGLKDTFIMIYKQKGIRGLYAGFTLDLLRAAIFSTFDTWSRETIENSK